MKYPFYKMEGCGNDYVYIDAFEYDVGDPAELSRRISDRHFGIGSDGLILVAPSKIADGKMEMYNLDGSRGKMCGNGIRCVGKFLHDIKGIDKKVLKVETLSGVKTLEMIIEGDEAVAAKVDMGKAVLDPGLIPVRLEGDRVIGRKINIGGHLYDISCISMGNPHCVVFRDDVEDLDLEKIGPGFETNEIFPEGVNTEFVKVLDKNRLRMRVWERGSGETWACGTGTCASVAAACLMGICDKGEDIRVDLNGGSLIINYTDERVLMTGPCREVFEGTIEI